MRVSSGPIGWRASTDRTRPLGGRVDVEIDNSIDGCDEMVDLLQIVCCALRLLGAKAKLGDGNRRDADLAREAVELEHQAETSVSSSIQCRRRLLPFAVLYDYDDAELRVHFVIHAQADLRKLDLTLVEW